MNIRRIEFLISMCCLMVLLALGWTAKAQMISSIYLPGRTIVLDAGHGGFDPGAVGVNDTTEAQINLSITLMLRAELVERGYCVILTREDENALGETKQADMQKRRDIIGQSEADYTVSIHLNANRDASCYGPVVLYHPDSEVGKQLAEKMQTVLNEMLRIVKPRTIQKGNYYILNSGPMPAVIVECGFITNVNDEALLKTEHYQAEVAQAIACGLDAFIAERADAANAKLP